MRRLLLGCSLLGVLPRRDLMARNVWGERVALGGLLSGLTYFGLTATYYF